ncbi:2-amino-4-hydroxy-6-hydroxymethyldihydropteridine pyrophosphokinase [Roseivivax sp. THAF40]|uniref:2-amino-4-hydroxy-6- hydroxymethyldihydropteridine diphosphokinase n=1 Tax=unclassified Roseivivax TaxID=2639302 RepID=UPI0012693BF8|nr:MULTISPECIES: 2-amino-4-hydroxy-6-hydroxymethyldihydropteridine diphosphokinase [unclassified Roseivivax]QFS84415.1 2-amino-4-hydroxy-6-hydroxymethyldihydropteridine pyrophosphokinase [Roseivivax sp. THAF197b]QFT48243.1 2-amino-4-hydroxy-6-hydroxymethyldihydropteridine pyrophosphokinase [Roseivivax sp. THAF40]
MAFKQVALIALGANLPNKQQLPVETLKAALTRLAAGPLRLQAVSRFFSTPCFPVNSGPDYVNTAAAFAVPEGMPSNTVLGELHAVEAEFGRERLQRWGMRTLDIDLIALGDEIVPDDVTQTRWRNLPLETQKTCAPDTLILPHPRVQDRGFVLVPLAEIAGDWTHPLTGKTLHQMRAALHPDAVAEIRPL